MPSIQGMYSRFLLRFSKSENAGIFVIANKEKNIKLSRKEKIFFLDTLGSLLNAGIPMVQSLKLIYFQSEQPNIKKLVAHVKNEVELWKGLATIARSLPNIFSAFDAAMFEMGDATGKIGTIFGTLTTKEEKTLDLERKIKGALTYPIAIVVIATLMVCVLMVYVIPRIQKIYADAHTSLPALTQGVINISQFLRNDGIIFLAFLSLLWVSGFYAMKQPKVAYEIDRTVLSLPIFGKLIKQSILVIFSDFLSILLSSGITIHKALDIVGSAISNTYYKQEVGEIITDIRKGKHLSSALGGEYVEKRMRGETIGEEEKKIGERRLHCFSIELSTAVKVGEQTGSLAKMLERASERYDKEIDTTVKSLSSLLEPIVIVVIGGIVGVIVLAIMMPFFNMVQVVG